MSKDTSHKIQEVGQKCCPAESLPFFKLKSISKDGGGGKTAL